MSDADRLTVAGGMTEFALMQRAGAEVARAAAEMAGGGRVLVLAGPGNNGGDGFVAAAELHRRGHSVRLAMLGEPDQLKGSAATAANSFHGAVERIGASIDLTADLIVDAIFGAGLSRKIDGEAAAVIGAVNASRAPVLAVDLPSGIDGRTGSVCGVAVRATRTITFFRLKPGHLLLPGREHCGSIELAQIGIPDSVLESIQPKTFRNLPALWASHMVGPRSEDHKYSRGHVVVVSGSAHATGAARLAAAGALRAGAGAVTVASPSDALLVNAAHLTAIMVRAVDSPGELRELIASRSPGAAVIGPGNGVGQRTAANVEAALSADCGVVLDADAITSFEGMSERLFRNIRSRRAPVMLTPHQGEFRRLFGENDLPRIDSARAAAETSGATIVLKGPDTVVAAPDGHASINANAPSYLATAGSGDVLAGVIAGLLAQGMPAFEAASAGVWLHGAAATRIGKGLIAEDLPAALPFVLQALDRSSGGLEKLTN